MTELEEEARGQRTNSQALKNEVEGFHHRGKRFEACEQMIDRTEEEAQG